MCCRSPKPEPLTRCSPASHISAGRSFSASKGLYEGHKKGENSANRYSVGAFIVASRGHAHGARAEDYIVAISGSRGDSGKGTFDDHRRVPARRVGPGTHTP